jgi:hypothetical protein
MSAETCEGRLDISMTELTDANLSVAAASMKFNLNCFPDDMVHVPGIIGGETCVLQLATN